MLGPNEAPLPPTQARSIKSFDSIQSERPVAAQPVSIGVKFHPRLYQETTPMIEVKLLIGGVESAARSGAVFERYPF